MNTFLASKPTVSDRCVYVVARLVLSFPCLCFVAGRGQVDMKSDERKQLGRIMLKGDTITLMQSV